jgi:hypothetical protein
MAKLIIGSSNVYRNYIASKFKKYGDYSMIRCTDIESFDANMAGLEVTDKEVVVSVIENFVDKAGRGLEACEEKDRKVEAAMERYLKIIRDAATRLSGSKFVIIEPIQRPGLDWFEVSHDVIRSYVSEGVKKSNLDNVTSIVAISRASQIFMKDGVHLTEVAGEIFIEGILSQSKAFFNAETLTLDDDDAAETMDQERSEPTPGGSGGNVDVDIGKKMMMMEAEAKDRRSNDNLLFARMREELDTMSNKNKEDRVVLTGITSATPPPVNPDERKVWLRTTVESIFKKISAGFTGKILFVNQGRNNGKMIPMVEVRLDSVASAVAIRKAFADKKKAGEDFGRLFLANCVGLATRVRVDIMKALAKRCTEGKDIAFVVAFTSRPMLHIRTTDTSGQSRTMTYTFSDSVAKFGNRLQQGDLDEAYRRAGTNFTGQLSQHFVVLSDKNTGFQHSGAYSRKRGRKEEDQNDFGYERGHGRVGGSGNRGNWRGNRGKGPRYNKYNK